MLSSNQIETQFKHIIATLIAMAQATYSPAKLRKEAFNTLTKQQLRELGKDKRKHNKVFENAKSIVDTSSALKDKQSSRNIDPNKRLIIVNHQIISEIAYKFPDYAWSKKASNRYKLLEFVINSIDEKAKGSHDSKDTSGLC